MSPRAPFFPAWIDTLTKLVGALIVGGLVYMIVLTAYATSPKTTAVGYQPTQPVAYSHAVHAGKLGLDCRYCHNTVETAAFAAVPPTQTCMNCHSSIRATSDKMAPIRESYATGNPVQWVQIHDLPDFVYFNHSAHVTRGIGCVSCHGRVDRMEEVQQVEMLSMGWCLECHRNPERHLRPKDQVTNMQYVPEGDQLEVGLRLKKEYGISPPTNCYTCHR